MPGELDGLIYNAVATPRDRLARLILADWLDESDLPAHHLWANYIRMHAAATGDPLRISTMIAESPIEMTLTLPAEEFVVDFRVRLELLPASQFTVTVENFAIARAALGRVDEPAADRWRGLPLAQSEGYTLVGMVAPSDDNAVAELATLVEGEVVPVRVPGDQLAHLVHRTFTRAIALVETPLVETVVSRPSSRPVRGDTPASYLDRLVAEARQRGATALELVAHAEEYQISLVYEVRPMRWMGLELELGRELAELAMLTPPAKSRGTPRPTRHGWGVRLDFV